MPKRLPLKELKPFFYAYRLGSAEVNGKVETQYAGLRYAKGQFIDATNDLSENSFGDKLDYDAYLLVEVNADTRFIDEFTRVWIRVLPNSSATLPDYQILKCGEPIDGLITIFLRSLVINNNSIWYEYNGTIYETNVDFKADKLEMVIPNNMFLPIDESTKVWYVEPEDTESTDGLLKLESREQRGNFNVLKFAEVEIV